MYSIKNLELSEALPLLVLTPGLVAILAFIFLGEALTIIEIIGLILLLIGIYVLVLEEKQTILQPFKRLFSSKYKYILLALSIFTLTSLLDKIILSRFNLPPAPFMAFQHLFFAIIFFFIFIFSGKKIKSLKPTIKMSGWLIFTLAIITIIYRYGEILAINTSSSVALAIAIKRISVFFAVLIGGKLFKEHNLLRRLIATALLVLGTLLII
jgi:drug/metabolite transporter (DMT)-like permease